MGQWKGLNVFVVNTPCPLLNMSSTEYASEAHVMKRLNIFSGDISLILGRQLFGSSHLGFVNYS